MRLRISPGTVIKYSHDKYLLCNSGVTRLKACQSRAILLWRRVRGLWLAHARQQNKKGLGGERRAQPTIA
jgi:hypothetical protein